MVLITRRGGGETWGWRARRGPRRGGAADARCLVVSESVRRERERREERGEREREERQVERGPGVFPPVSNFLKVILQRDDLNDTTFSNSGRLFFYLF